MEFKIAMLSNLDEKLITYGYNGLSLEEKNRLAVNLSNRLGMPATSINEEILLEYHKAVKCFHFSEKCNDDIVNGFTASNGHIYRTNRDDQINMIGQRDELMSDESITTVAWKTQDAGYINHTRDEWLNIYKEAFAHKKNLLLKYNAKKQAVLNATSHEDIVAITWEDENETE